MWSAIKQKLSYGIRLIRAFDQEKNIFPQIALKGKAELFPPSWKIMFFITMPLDDKHVFAICASMEKKREKRSENPFIQLVML